MIRPMLAATITDITTLKFPLLASYKLDGIRCLIVKSSNTGNRLAVSRSLKPIQNIHIRTLLEASCLPVGTDGELVVGKNFQQTASGVMSSGGYPEFKYYVFDYFGEDAATQMTYINRLNVLNQYKDSYTWFSVLTQQLIENLEMLNTYETMAIADGAEGVMLRDMHGKYKFGRSTLKESYLLKLKRFVDAEARVVGFTEMMANGNRPTTSPTGYTERSSDQDGLIPCNMLGALIVKDALSGVEFNIGSGFTLKERWEIWCNKDRYMYKHLTYKYQNFGVKDKPRTPIFRRWRLDRGL